MYFTHLGFNIYIVSRILYRTQYIFIERATYFHPTWLLLGSSIHNFEKYVFSHAYSIKTENKILKFTSKWF
jgi:hypothetical protein